MPKNFPVATSVVVSWIDNVATPGRGDLNPRDAFATWLLPVVPPSVSASTGAALIAHLPNHGAQGAMLFGCYALLGVSVAVLVAVGVRVAVFVAVLVNV